MIKSNYGKYSIPKMLDRVIQFQNQLNKDGLLKHGDLLGLYFKYDDLDSRYLNTPLDVISFAWPGADGIHFGFLTDFGQVKDLDSAYIVRVSPMDFGDPVRIVARNLYDFLRILCTNPNWIETVDITTSKEYFIKLISETDYLEQDKASEMFLEAFQLEPINSLYDYLQKVKQERYSEIILATEDSIGVIWSEESSEYKDLFNFENVETLDIEKVHHFFEKSSTAAKLAFLRDAQSNGLLYDNPEIKRYLKEQLPVLGLNDEAVRID